MHMHVQHQYYFHRFNFTANCIVTCKAVIIQAQFVVDKDLALLEPRSHTNTWTSMKQCFFLNLNCTCDELNMESISIHFHWDCTRFRSEDIIVFVKVAMCILCNNCAHI